MTDAPSIAVVVITYRRPKFLDECLAHLERQERPPDQVIVVDASPDVESQLVVAEHSVATYVRNPAGAGNQPNSRNAALPLVTCEVIAFLDDDAYAEPDYLRRLAEFCAERPDVALGCGRALNGVPDEQSTNTDRIGVLTDSGELVGNFAADPGKDVPIDHGLGATMWIRRELMDQLGAFREYFGGTAACEETDLFLRARKLGRQAWLVHRAVAVHVAAPQVGGQRFDIRYTYWAAHNKAILLTADAGALSVRFARSTWAEIVRQLRFGGAAHRRIARTAVVTGAWLKGVLDALRLFGRGPANPVVARGRAGRPGG